jgi:hypothetical protein
MRFTLRAVRPFEEATMDMRVETAPPFIPTAPPFHA